MSIEHIVYGLVGIIFISFYIYVGKFIMDGDRK